MDVPAIAKIAFTPGGPGAGSHPQLQQGQLRLAGPQVLGRPTAEVHRRPAPGDQKDPIRLYGHIKVKKGRAEFLAFLR